MASTKASNARTSWTYTDEDGNDYVVSAKTAYVVGDDSAKFGGAAGADTDQAIPNGFKMRRVKCKSAAGATRWMVAYTEAATIWTTPGTTVTLNYGGVDTVFTALRTKRAERAERYGKDPLPA